MRNLFGLARSNDDGHREWFGGNDNAIAYLWLVSLAFILIGFLVVWFALAALSPKANAASRTSWAGPFPAILVKVLDGDTHRLEIVGECRFGCVNGQIDLRLRNIDTPEKRLCRVTKSIEAARRASCELCVSAVKRSKLAKFHATAFLQRGPLRVIHIGPGKYYRRAIGNIEVYFKGRWHSLRDELLRLGHGVEYAGGKKTKDWCAL